MAQAEQTADVDEELIGLAVKYQHDPRGWVQVAYDWGHGDLSDLQGPRDWQDDILSVISRHLANPKTRFHPLRIAVASGHGIGKTALMGMVVNWGMSTCDDCKVVITANTGDQMRTKTAPEISKWQRSSITAHWFDIQATSISARDKDHSRSWRTDFVTWSENNTEAFAGLHNKRKRIIILYDEASGIFDKVWEVTEGALTDEDTEIIFIAFGNPTVNTGRFRECFRKFRKRWVTRQIDSRTVPGTNKKLIKEWLEDYGENSDFFKVRVRGMFPAMGAKQFISADDVDAARGRHLRREQYSFAPVIIGVDPAWTGGDEFVIVKRQGLYSKILAKFEKNDNDVQMAAIIARFEDEEKADAVFVDAGFGTGIKSAGDTMGRSWRLVWFSGKPIDPGCLNKRAEIWKEMRDWLKKGGAIPPDDVLYQDLIGPELLSTLDGKIALESKDAMKARGVPSPNRADALALTFAEPVQKRETYGETNSDSVEVEYNPYG